MAMGGRPRFSEKRAVACLLFLFFYCIMVYILYLNSMQFEFDPKKSAANKQKHGIDFVEAQALWDDWDVLEIPAKTVEDEGRWLVVGKIGSNHWSAVITYRDDSLRIISVRRSREKEVVYYGSSEI